MTKKVLGLVASPRKGGNSEMFLKEALLAEDSWDKEIIRLHELNINPCRACYRCLPQGATCVINDDFQALLEKIRTADGIILAAPVYFLGPIAALKKFMDRCLSVGTDAHRTAGKPCLVLTVYGIDNWQGLGREYNNLFARSLALDLKDSLLFHSAYPGKAFLESDVKEQIRATAAHLFDPTYSKKLEPNCCPTCWNPFLSIKDNGAVWCPICGQEGKIRPTYNNEIQVDFLPTSSNRFSAEELNHHFGVSIQQTITEFVARRDEVKELQTEYNKYDWNIKLGKTE